MSKEILILILGVFFMLDVATTIYALKRNGLYEDNGFVRKAIEAVGRDRWLILSKFAVLFALAIWRADVPVGTLYFWWGFYTMLVIYNCRTIWKNRRR